MWGRRNSNSANKTRDTLVKTALVGHLGEAVRGIQRQQAESSHHCDIVESSSEAAHTLCCVLEALFIHRLRDSFVERFTNVFTGDVVKQPSPNFWPFLVAFSHRNVIDQLAKDCPWLKSDVGRCRAWIRLVLNDGLLTSYLELFGRERRVLAGFYEAGAFLRDSEHVDITRKLLSGLETLQFKLAINNSILNNWSSTPLLLAGLWAAPAPFLQEAVVQGVDAAVCFANEEGPEKPKYDKTLERPGQTIDEDLAFRLIIESSSSTPTPSVVATETQPAHAVPIVGALAVPSTSGTVKSLGDDDSGFGSAVVLSTSAVAETVDSLPKEEPRCSTPEVKQDIDPEPVASKAEMEHYRVTLNDSSSEAATFELLLENYSSLNTNKPLDLNDLTKPSSEDKRRSSSLESNDFEILTSDKPSLGIYGRYLDKISTETGLHLQNYRCVDCGHSIGTIYGKPKVCSFTGSSYCSDCHDDEEALIPARVLLNADWSMRKVSKSSAVFLRQIGLEPVLHAQNINPKIYDIMGEFSALLVLRLQLYHLRGYLFTCKSDIGEIFRKKLWPRDHLCEDVHLYAVADLPLVLNGQLEQQLVKLIQLGREHINSCQLCFVKGFVCEVCKDSKIIFPFDLKETYSCAECGATFHQKCMDRFKPCPRCQRRKQKLSSD